MILTTTQKLTGAKQTGQVMHLFVRKFFNDMAPYASMSLPEIYEKIKRLPFRHDPRGIELVKRPMFTMQQIGAGGDCDDKSVALASWAVLNGIPYRFIAVGRKKPNKRKILLSHVFPQLYIYGSWLSADPTYAFNQLGTVQGDYDRVEVL